MNDQGTSSPICAVPVPPETGNLKSDRMAFCRWVDESAANLTAEQLALAQVIAASFINLLTMNKNKPAAWARLKELHDADVAKLQAMIAG